MIKKYKFVSYMGIFMVALDLLYFVFYRKADITIFGIIMIIGFALQFTTLYFNEKNNVIFVKPISTIVMIGLLFLIIFVLYQYTMH